MHGGRFAFFLLIFLLFFPFMIAQLIDTPIFRQ
jgi:hypothetical protein